MDSKSELSYNEVKRLVDEIKFEVTKVYLTDVEEIVLKASHTNTPYAKIGGNYTEAYYKEVGKNVWDILSNKLEEKVSKTNFMQALVRYQEKQDKKKQASLLENTPMEIDQNTEPLTGQIPLDSHFYIERRNVDSLCYETIRQPGALIRIKSPQKMGKTLLLAKLLDHAKHQGYQIAKLNLELADRNTLTDLKTFLQWLCVEVSDSLEIQSKLEEYWQDFSGSKTNCNNYFQRYLLSSIECPLVLAIDNCELLFEFPDVFSEFFPLLRVWHDNAKQGDRVGNIWRKLRVVLVHSTESYPSLDTNHSPFNAGVPVELPDFDLLEVKTLAKLYELDLKEKDLLDLIGLVGGHPYFVQEAFTKLKNQQTTLDQLLRLAPTEEGIYHLYLQQQLWILQHNLQLESAYREVVMANEPVRLKTEVAFKLHSMGLVKRSRNDCIPSYELCRQYFSVHLE